MDMVLRYRGRVIRESDLAVIRALIEQYPTASRRRLSRELCEIWNWMQPNGAACDMICRGLMLALERAGHIALPPVRSKPINPLVSRPRPPLIKTDTTPIECDLKDLGPLQFRLVRRTPEEPLFNSLIEHHHYLHYTHPVGEQLKRYAASLSQPFCGPSGDAEAAAWFGEGASHVRSVAHMALRNRECFGMLALGSEDVLRFYPEMGTLYLKRMGELAGAALLRFL